MKKILFCFATCAIISCASDDVTELPKNDEEIQQPDKDVPKVYKLKSENEVYIDGNYNLSNNIAYDYGNNGFVSSEIINQKFVNGNNWTQKTDYYYTENLLDSISIISKYKEGTPLNSKYTFEHDINGLIVKRSKYSNNKIRTIDTYNYAQKRILSYTSQEYDNNGLASGNPTLYTADYKNGEFIGYISKYGFSYTYDDMKNPYYNMYSEDFKIISLFFEHNIVKIDRENTVNNIKYDYNKDNFPIKRKTSSFNKKNPNDINEIIVDFVYN